MTAGTIKQVPTVAPEATRDHVHPPGTIHDDRKTRYVPQSEATIPSNTTPIVVNLNAQRRSRGRKGMNAASGSPQVFATHRVWPAKPWGRTIAHRRERVRDERENSDQSVERHGTGSSNFDNLIERVPRQIDATGFRRTFRNTVTPPTRQRVRRIEFSDEGRRENVATGFNVVRVHLKRGLEPPHRRRARRFPTEAAPIIETARNTNGSHRRANRRRRVWREIRWPWGLKVPVCRRDCMFFSQ